MRNRARKSTAVSATALLQDISESVNDTKFTGFEAPVGANEETAVVPTVANPFVDSILEHARTWYERDGWDFLIETVDYADIEKVLVGCKTHRGAIIKVRKAFGLLERNAHRKEMEAASKS